MKKRDNLINIQEWMHGLIVDRGDLRQKLQNAKEQKDLTILDVIAYKKNIPPLSRLQVYASGFEIRLIECLRADFPLLRKFMTDAVFDQFARAYLHYHQPSSFTLFKLGANFPAFLQASKPKQLPNELLDRFEFPYALATYERAFLESTRAKGAENETPDKGIDPLLKEGVSLFEMPIIQSLPCLRCLELDFPIEEFAKKIKTEESVPTIPGRAKEYLAITRMAYRMKVIKLQPWQYHFLKATEIPINANEAARIAADQVGIESGKVIADTMFFLPTAFQDGILKKNS